MRLSNTNNEDLAARQPEQVDDFFKSVRMGCFPAAEAVDTKAQPWKRIWAGPKPPSVDGEMLVACPKNCAFGRFKLFPLIHGL
jgi:hypothetical protein